MIDAWWRDASIRGRVFQAISAANEARSEAKNDLEALEALSRSVNQLFSAQTVVESSSAERPEDTPSDTRMFKRLLKACAVADKEWLVGRESLTALAQFDPPIADHYELRHWLLDQAPPDDLVHAQSAHIEFRRRWERFADQPTSANRGKTLDSLARILWTVRSNRVHGEKSVRSPDRDRVTRNAAVAHVVRAVLEDVIEAVFGRPSTRLVVYGTLGPGESNYPVVADLHGHWAKARLQGELHEWHGYPAFVWIHPGESIDAWVLTSDALPREWDRIDQFEGNAYARHLLPLTTESEASFDVANGYELLASPLAT